jgi:hypothetical protein
MDKGNPPFRTPYGPVLLFSSENDLFVCGLLERQGRKQVKWSALANANAAKRPVYLAEVTR